MRQLRRIGFRGLVFTVFFAALALPPAAQAAGKSGIAAAALTTTRGTPPGEDTRVLKIGVDIFQDERIVTDEKGKAQLLFLDGTALTIGPNSDLTLDEFVYDPQAKTGKLAFAATKGVFRLVGGAISKRNPITLKTPTATIGVRGGISFINVAEALRAIFVFGDEMSVTSDGVTKTAQRPGLQINVPAGGGAPSDPAPTTDADVSADLNNMEGSSDDDTGSDVAVSDDDVAGSQVGELGSSAGPGVNGVGGVGADGLGGTGAAESSTNLTNASQDNAQTGTGGGVSAANTVGLSGRYKHSFTTLSGSDDGQIGLDIAFQGGTIGGGLFSVNLASFLTFPAAIVGTSGFSGATDTTDSPFGAISGTVFINETSDFLFIQAIEDLFPSHLIYAFAGVPTPIANFPSSGVTSFAGFSDHQLGGSRLPFVRAVDGGLIQPGYQAKAHINWQAGSSGGAPGFLASNFVISGRGASQQAAGSLATGDVLMTSPFPHLRGGVAGVSSPDSDVSTPFSLIEGAIGTSDGLDGSDFFGTSAPIAFSLNSSEVDTSDTIIETSTTVETITAAMAVTGTDYNANVPFVAGLNDASNAGDTRTSRTLLLETGGISRDVFANGASIFFRRMVTDPTVTGSLVLDADTGRMRARADVVSLDGGFANPSFFTFGTFTASDGARSGFINDDLFGAIETSAPFRGQDSGVNILDNALFFTSHAGVTLDGVLPSGVSLCGACQFTEMGFWGGRMQDGFDPTHYHEFFLVPWAAAAPVAASQFNVTQTASFSGVAVANVYNNTVAPARLSVEYGNFDATVAISPGLINITALNISNLDGGSLSMSGSGAAPGPIAVTGSGNHPTGGGLGADGRFRFAGPGTPPQEIFGHFAAGNDGGTYLLGGVAVGRNPAAP